jgi:hypothetical protein
VRLRHTYSWSALRAEIFQKSNSKSLRCALKSLAKPLRDFLYLGTLRVEIIQKLNSKIIRASR